jgi:hypothetical protein
MGYRLSEFIREVSEPRMHPRCQKLRTSAINFTRELSAIQNPLKRLLHEQWHRCLETVVLPIRLSEDRLFS